MANTLTAVLPIIFEAMDVVSREMVGAVNAVYRDSSAERAALNQVITYPVVPQAALEDVTPGATPADSGDQTIGSGTMSITKSKVYPIRWTGEEQLSLRAGDTPQGSNIMRDQFSQAFRTLVNTMEADIAALHTKASRAVGTAGTTPFSTASDLSDAANVLRVLDDNGAPTTDRHIVLGSAAIAAMRGKQSVLFKINEAGTSDLLRRGILGDLEGLQVHSSSQILTSTAGTAASATTNNAGYAVGATTLTLASAGTGTLVAGDVVTFAGDTNQYVIVTGDTDVSNGGTFVIAAPGLKVAMSAATKAITVVAAAVRNMGFSRNAIHMITRAPAMPEGGDFADDVTEITDPFSGLSFQVALYRQYRRIKYEIGAAWGVSMVKPEHAVVLLG